MALTTNFYYQGPDMPGATVCPTELNPFQNIRRLPAIADVADLLVAGTLCYLTSTTNLSDMTPCVTEHGQSAAEGIICVVEIKQMDPYLPTTTDIAVYPNRVPNTTCTITDYSPAANTNITVIPLEPGMIVWVLGSTDGSFDTTFSTSYIAAANGLIKAEAQPTGAAIDIRAQTFTSIATTVNQNWALTRYEGVKALDNSA